MSRQAAFYLNERTVCVCPFIQLERMAECVLQQRQSGSSRRETTAFLVLTQALLLGMGDLGGTQHLHMAQQVYNLLEPALLELTQQDQVRGTHGHAEDTAAVNNT